MGVFGSTVFILFIQMVVGSLEAQFHDSETCFFVSFLITVEIEDEGRKAVAKVSCCCLG